MDCKKSKQSRRMRYLVVNFKRWETGQAVGWEVARLMNTRLVVWRFTRGIWKL